MRQLPIKKTMPWMKNVIKYMNFEYKISSKTS